MYSDKIKAYGAGLLSSFGELEYCLTDEPEVKPFDPEVTGSTKYPITKYQVHLVIFPQAIANLIMHGSQRTSWQRVLIMPLRK